MKGISFIFTVLFFSSSATYAFSIESHYVQTEKNEYLKMWSLKCESYESADCLFLCGSAEHCQKTEPYCLNCAGTTWPILKEIFTMLSANYQRSTKPMEKRDLLNYLQERNFVIFDSHDIFNYYKPIEGHIFLEQIESFCSGKEGQPLLVIQLDEVNIPQELSFILCQDGVDGTQGYWVQKKLPEIGRAYLNSIFNMR